ncbi:MAG: ATP-binding protein [Bdellovibrionales bacterium]|nr:ATP-binding protein [Bdellovibrionales bacterium]
MAMAHERARQCLSLLLKKIGFSPIVSIQGPRQCGKSYLAKNILSKKLKSTEFITLDSSSMRKQAEASPRFFLTAPEVEHLIIDEFQKVPILFDEVKAIVDENRRPGRFIILGSTEFSIEAKIKESLTGRLSRIRIFPMNLSEVKKIELNSIKKFPFLYPTQRVPRTEVFRYLKNGGLPGIFVVKSELERKSLMKDWIDLTVNRDLFQFSDKKLDSDIAEGILFQIAHLEEASAINIARAMGKSITVISRHLKPLQDLFIINEVKPFSKSAGKPIFYLCDVGLLDYLNAPMAKKIETWINLELKSQLSYKGIFDDKICFFRSLRSQPIHFVNQSGKSITAVKVIHAEHVDRRDILVFESLKKKYSTFHINSIILYGGENQFALDDVHVYPWERIV